MMKRCNWRHSATTWFKRQGTVALLAAATGLGSMHSLALADVIGIGDVSPFETVDGETFPDLPPFGNAGEDPALPPIPLLIVGGTGFNVGGTAAGQMTIDIPADTFPLLAVNAIIGGNRFGLGLARVVGLNSQWSMEETLIIGDEGQGFLELIAGGRLSTNGSGMSSETDPDLIMGFAAGSQGFALLDGFGSLMVNTNVSIGFEGFGDLQIINSSRMETLESASIGTEIDLNNNALGQGYVLVDGLGTRWNVGLIEGTESAPESWELSIGEEGRGTLEITNQGRVQSANDTYLGREAGAYGEAIVTGRNSLLWTREEMHVGSAHATNPAAGVVHINDNGMVRNDTSTTINRLGTVNLAGGTLLTPLVTNAGGVIRGDGVIDAAVVTNGVGTSGGDIRNAAAVANERERLLFTGAVTNNAGSIIESQGGEMEFVGAVVNNGQIFGRDAIFRFRGGVTGTGGEMFIGNSTVESLLPLTVAALTVDDSGSSTVIGDLTLSGDLNMEIGYSFSKLFVTGDANLGGDLNITLQSGFTPYVGQSWEIIAAGDVTGAFAAVNAPAIPGVTWGVQTVGDSAFLTTSFVAPPAGSGADFNGDGIVDGNDLIVWQDNFGLGSNPPPAATQADGDANGDGVVDGSDFLLIQQQFGGPPPAVPAASAVPEPSSVVLAMAALGLPLAARRRRK